MRSGLGVPVVLVVAGLLAGCASAAGTPPPSAQPSTIGEPTTSAPSGPATPTPIASQTPIPSSPVVPLPSATLPPAAAGLLRLTACGDAVPVCARMDYLADGRVIDATGDRTTAPAERTLSPAGRARLAARIARDADLLSADLTVENVPRPGVTPLGHGVESYEFDRATDRGVVRVRAISDRSLEPELWLPDARRSRLTALAEELLDPATLAGADGWVENAWRAWTPEAAAILLSAFVPRGGTHLTDVTVPDVAATLGVDPAAIGSTAAPPQDALYARCAVLPAATWLAIGARLAAAKGSDPPSAVPVIDFASVADSRVKLEIYVRGLLPDEIGTGCP